MDTSTSNKKIILVVNAMFYKIISDNEKLNQFIEWLPELEPNEKFYVSLFARSKYSDNMPKIHKCNLKRFTSDKERLAEKLAQLELPLGRWKLKEEPVPQEALAVYITPNPRCLKTAAFKTIEELLRKLQQPNPFDPLAVSKSEIHRSKSRSWVVDFDIDLPEENRKEETERIMDVIEQTVGKDAVDFVITRGGMHALIKPQLVVSEIKNWHPVIKKSCQVDQVGDLLMPIPGCVQGGFTPYIAQRS